jgi:subtilisin-like proprotein convertase family protein
VTIASTIFTSTHYHSTGRLDLTGLVTDTNGVENVGVVISDTWSLTSTVEGNVWTAAWYTDLDSPPDGVTYPITVTATDIAGRTAQDTSTVLVDVVAPAPVTLTLTSASGAITPGLTLREISPTLTLTWTAANDNSGLANYVVDWATVTSDTITHHVSHLAPHASRVSQYTAAEAQRIRVHLGSQDIYGNQRWQEIGPIYVDHPLTPDYVTLSSPPGGGAGGIYHGWMESGCTQIGADNRIRDHAFPGAALDEAQELYATWNQQALRFTWSGANWDNDGDLFIYLDTQTGGADRVYDPYTATTTNTVILLPAVSQASTVKRQAPNVSGLSHRALLTANAAAQSDSRMEADYLIWVQDSQTAVLLRWDALYQEWRDVDGDWGYIFTDGDAPLTDLYLPFNLLGLPSPSGGGAGGLSLVAFATEDDGLRLWATMPARNSVNSPRVLDAVITTGVQYFPLTHSYTWASLGSGLCPNGTQSSITQHATQSTGQRFTGSDVRLSLDGDPPGIAYSVLGDNLFFAMSSLDQFAGSADWDSIQAELCAANPNAPECERAGGATSQLFSEATVSSLPDKDLLAQQDAIPAPPGYGAAPRLPAAVSQSGGESDFDAQDGLGALMDVDHPALGDAQPITYTLTYANRGAGTATGLYADVVTWGPMRLPDGMPLSDEYGQYDWLLLPLGDLGPGETMTATFRGHTDLSYDPGNRNGWATIDLIVYDDTGSVYDDQLDWLYLDYEYDDQPPVVGITALPALLGPFTNTVNGFAFDQSAVPTVTLAVEGGQTWDCQDDTPGDGTWSCAWDVGAANEGAVFHLRARATDEHGQVGVWTNWQAFTVDAIPPTITLGVATEAALYDGLLGPGETTLSGQLFDNRLVGAVEACDAAGESCERTDLLVDATTLPQNTFTYEDVPETPIAIDARTACYGGTEIFRTFTITESFTIADVALALNIDHEYRYDVTGWLVAPSGTWAAILWDGASADNYDVRLSDAALFANGKDRTSHDTDAPYYENERRPDQPLSLFNGERTAGDWKLVLCDYFPEKDNGAYNRSQLILTADTLPESTEAMWSYSLPDVENSDDVTHTLSLYGLDSVGNRSTEGDHEGSPLHLAFRVDTVAPVITVTHQPSGTLLLNETFDIYIAGSVSDGGEIAATQLRILAPNGDFQSLHLYPTGGTWVFTDTYYFVRPGFYSIWIEAADVAGNVASVGPFEMRASVPQLVYLPLVMRNHTYTCQDIYEPDDDSAQARAIATDGESQRHNLFPAGDVDWVVFDVEDAGVNYVIETFDLDPSADTIIYLYDSDGERLLDWNDDAEPGTVASYLYFNPYHAGTFYVRVVHYDSGVEDCDTQYSIRVIAQP